MRRALTGPLTAVALLITAVLATPATAAPVAVASAAGARTAGWPGPAARPGPTAAATNPYGDGNLVSMFDGRTLTGWTASAAGDYDVKDGAIHTTGQARGYLYYQQQVGTFRWIFTVRQVVGTNHDPTVLFWGTTNPVRDALSSIQFQPPDGFVWDYRPGHNNDAKALVKRFSHPKPALTVWNQCEVIGNQGTGVAKMACCPVQVTGKPCQATLLVQFTDPTAARVGPLAIQTHNAGIQDEYRDLYVESPVRTKPDDFITTSPIP